MRTDQQVTLSITTIYTTPGPHTREYRARARHAVTASVFLLHRTGGRLATGFPDSRTERNGRKGVLWLAAARGCSPRRIERCSWPLGVEPGATLPTARIYTRTEQHLAITCSPPFSVASAAVHRGPAGRNSSLLVFSRRNATAMCVCVCVSRRAEILFATFFNLRGVSAARRRLGNAQISGAVHFDTGTSMVSQVRFEGRKAKPRLMGKSWNGLTHFFIFCFLTSEFEASRVFLWTLFGRIIILRGTALTREEKFV